MNARRILIPRHRFEQSAITGFEIVIDGATLGFVVQILGAAVVEACVEVGLLGGFDIRPDDCQVAFDKV